MLVNSLVGAGDILLLFFLQAKLPEVESQMPCLEWHSLLWNLEESLEQG